MGYKFQRLMHTPMGMCRMTVKIPPGVYDQFGIAKKGSHDHVPVHHRRVRAGRARRPTVIALTVAAAVVVGVTLGVLGGGGSILMVPLLAYVAGMDAKVAIATSLLVVGA